MKTSYRLEKTTIGKKWDEFVKSSWNGILFSYSIYLKSISCNPQLYYCYNKQELRAAIVVLETEDHRSLTLHGLVVHNGIIFGSPANKQNLAQQNSERFRITEFIAEELPQIYKNIELRLDPLCQDIRPFLWVNYGTNSPKYQVVNIRYTSYLSIKNLYINWEDSEIFENLSSSRKQEVRYANRKGVVTREEFKQELFIEFLMNTYLRQGIEIDHQVIEENVQLIKQLFEANLGYMFVSYTKDNIPGSIAFFGIDHKRAYYLFGANDPALRNEHTGTAVLWDAFKFLGSKGIDEVDMEGVNSPERGWFKLSFGGTISSYYHLSYHGN